MTVKNKFRLAKIKTRAIDLRANNQIPKYLVKAILDLTESDEIEYVTLLMQLSEHYLRVKGYYKKYPALDIQYSNEIKQCIADYKKIKKGEN